MFLLCCLVLLSCVLQVVGSSEASEDLGTSVLIPLGLQTQDLPYQVVWRKGRSLVGRIHRGQCTYGCSETSSVFMNGSLFLSRIQRGDEGVYMAVVYNRTGVLIHQAEVHLQLVDVSADHLLDLSLDSGSLSPPQQVQWSRGEEDVGRVDMGHCVRGCHQRPQLFGNGSLFLRSVQKADEGMYSALGYNASLYPVHRTDIFLYVNGSEAAGVSEIQPHHQRLSVFSIIFISEMVVFCLGIIIIMMLGGFQWRQRDQEKTDNGKYSVSYVEIQRNSFRQFAEWSRPSTVTDPEVEMQELKQNEENVQEVEVLTTFQ